MLLPLTENDNFLIPIVPGKLSYTDDMKLKQNAKFFSEDKSIFVTNNIEAINPKIRWHINYVKIQQLVFIHK